MVGIVGTIGELNSLPVDEHLRWSGSEIGNDHVEGPLTIGGSFHPTLASDQPAETPDGTARVWLLGELYGYEPRPRDGRRYHARPAAYDSAEYFATLYDEHGLDFVSGANGNYIAFVLDRDRDTFHLVSDRLGSVPLFTATMGDGMVFSSSIQTLARHPAVSTDFDDQFVHEYLVFKRSFGIKTPLTGIERHPPGSITTIDIETGTRENRDYWRPRHRPNRKPFSYFVDRFADLFQSVVKEWVDDDERTYGLLLSGGSDSRLCLAALDDHAEVTTFHMSGWMSREARMAERTALTADVDFEWLRRDETYQKQALERNPRISNFNGWFSQAYVTGFHETIVSKCDVLVSGMYADTLFKGHAIPSPEINLGRLGEFEVPFEHTIDTVDEYIDWLLDDISVTLDLPTDIRTVLSNNITETDGVIDHHGVTYDSIDDLVHAGKWYPLTNDDDMIFRNSLSHLRPYRTPYLDNRLIDLALEMPHEYQLRRNIINAGLKRIAPELAHIPHAHTGIPLTRSFPSEYIETVGRAFWQKHIRSEKPPKRFLSNGPWVDDAELIRMQDFPAETIDRNEDLIRALPFLDWEDIIDCYNRHLEGENRIVELYGLLTFLEMPVTRRLVDGTTSSPLSITEMPSSPEVLTSASRSELSHD